MTRDSKQIWKYPFALNDVVEIEMPKGARVLTVQTQFEAPCLWAIVDPHAFPEIRRFAVHGTGHRVYKEVNPADYVGTFQLNDGSLVFHVFEIKGVP